MEVVDGRAQGQQFLPFLGGERCVEKGHIERAGGVDHGRREGLVPGDRRYLCVGAEEGGDFIAQRPPQFALDEWLQRRHMRVARVVTREDHVAAGDERFDRGKTHRREQAAQRVHLDGVAAHVDRTQERNIAGHGKVTSAGASSFKTNSSISAPRALANPRSSSMTSKPHFSNTRSEA